MATEGLFEVSTWKLDLVKSHFSAKKKPILPQANDQKSRFHDDDRTSPNVTSPHKDLTGDEERILKSDLDIKSIIVEPSSIPPVPLSTSTHSRKRIDVNEEGVEEDEAVLKQLSTFTKEQLPELPEIYDVNGWCGLDDAIRPLKTVSSTNSRIITPPEDDADTESSVSKTRVDLEPNPILQVKSTRPKIISNKCKFPVSLESVKRNNDRDQGRNCVVVIFKSRTTDTTIQRERTVLTTRKGVDKVLKKFSLKYNFCHSSNVRSVYNLCFHSATETRKFARDLSDIMAKSSSGPKALQHFLCYEDMLGRWMDALVFIIYTSI